jgi:hypothetical protein
METTVFASVYITERVLVWGMNGSVAYCLDVPIRHYIATRLELYVARIALRKEKEMTKQLYELEFDEAALGPMWMNLDNLKLMVYSKHYCIKPELLSIRAVTKPSWKARAGWIAIGLALVVLTSAAVFCTTMTAISAWDLSRYAGTIWN